MAPRDSSPDAPRLDFREPRHLTPAEAADLTATAEMEGRLLQDADLGSPDLSGGRLVESVLEAVTFSEMDMTETTVAESRLERVSGVHLQAARSTWRDVQLIGSRWGVVELYDALLSGVEIAGSKLDLVNLRSAEVRDVVFTGCTIGELDLSSARAGRLQLIETTVETLVLSGAQLKDTDLRGLEMQKVVGLEHLRGSTVSTDQLALLAPALADHLGITVSD